MNDWIAKHPTCLSHDDKKNDEYIQIMEQLVSGINKLNDGDNPEQLQKIVKTIAKQVVIKK
jgi:hypothetical protein